MIAKPTLRQVLDSARSATKIDPLEFAKFTTIAVDELARLADVPEAQVTIDSDAPKLQTYLRQSLAILEEALVLNGDEELVLQWFRENRLPEFEMKTPAALVSEGKAASILGYIRSIESGASG